MRLKKLLEIVANAIEELFHVGGILSVDDILKDRKSLLDFVELSGGVWIEQNFLQEVIVFRHQSMRDFQMPLESGSRSVLVFHDAGENQSAGKGNGEREGDSLIVLLEGVFENIKVQPAIEVSKEHLTQIIALANDYGIFASEIVESSESGAKHWMSAHVWVMAISVKFRQTGLDRSYVGNYAVGREVGHYAIEGGNGVFYGYRIN